MLELYYTKNINLKKKIDILLARKLKSFEIKSTPNGKPYIEGDPIYFSITHSSRCALIALCDRPVGVDAELIKKRAHLAVLSRFSARERAEIGENTRLFLQNWVVKEAYVKLLGGSVFKELKKLEYIDGKLLSDGNEVSCGYARGDYSSIIYSVCAEGYTKDEITDCKIKIFRLHKGETI